ncbi:MAG: ferrous iron transport protein B [Propionibacteriaceae bacterium]|nr:ferrous iron transport protein B [Propionibacteriaceae bacterium]
MSDKPRFSFGSRPSVPRSVKVACHGSGPGTGAGAGAPVVALAGSPNSGKSTIFNALTGARVTMGNWPGTTVEVARGIWRARTEQAPCHGEGAGVETELLITLVDLPGAYSLDPLSPDEALTRQLVVDAPVDEQPDVTVVVADAAHLARSLYLVAQLRERDNRIVVALTMLDVAAHRGIEADADALAARLGCPVVALNPRRRTGLDELTRVVGAELAAESRPPRPVPDAGAEDELALEDDRFSFVDAAIAAATTSSGERRVAMSDRIDRWVTAPVLGPLIFLAVMWVVFQVTTTVAAPMQDGLDALFTGPVSEGASALLRSLGLGETWLEGLIVDGLIAGVGMLLTFVPLMALMFILLALLEDSGYMARAAVVADRMMRAIGLPGQAFLPLIVGFGCNVPAISATRSLPSPRQRILTVLLLPFTSCTARLTVYVLVGTVFFGPWAGTVVFIMYLLSILLVVGVGFLLRKTLWRTMGTDPLVLDLPPYQRPTLRLTAAVSWTRLKGFLQTASGVIVITVTLVWLLQSIPAGGEGKFGDVPVEDSAYAVAAKAVTPVFAPAGFGEWRTTSALVVGFVAKEAVVSSWAQTYAVDEPESEDEPGELGERISADFSEASGGHPLPAVMAFLVFLLAYTPCVATLAAQKREVGWAWTLFGVVMQLAVAWGLAVLIFQVGRLFW